MALDKGYYTQLPEAVSAVAQNVSLLDQDGRMRVLLAVAVLYGLIKPHDAGAPEGA